EYIQAELEKLGKWTYPEKVVSVIFVLMVFFWIVQPWLSKVPGFGGLSDAMIAMSGAILFFLYPSDWQKRKFLLESDSVQKIPWDSILLFGGGLSLAAMLDKTGL